MSKKRLKNCFREIDANRKFINNPQNVNAVLFANQSVPIDQCAIDELLSLIELNDTIDTMYKAVPDIFDEPPAISGMALTPDFHKGAGIPIGTVMATKGFIVPQAVGNDINCGMRLHTTTISREQVEKELPRITRLFRHIYFEGGRDIPMTGSQRKALLQNGISGLLESTSKSLQQGIWSSFHKQNISTELERISQRGSLYSETSLGLENYIGLEKEVTRDDQIGSIGGGNHFVELQYISRIIDGTKAHSWGLRPGMVTIMVHSGSLNIGHICAGIVNRLARESYPKTLSRPRNGIYPLPTGNNNLRTMKTYWNSLSNAGNFAFVNRLFLVLMAAEALRKIFGDVKTPLLYDSPHNFVWEEVFGDEKVFIHRKGACPANGMEKLAGTCFAYYGEPVIVPGSMGATSYLMAGKGCVDSWNSAAHGAGRLLSRGDAMHGNDEEFETFMRRFNVVTPIDLEKNEIKARNDIVSKKLADIKQEAPFAYKNITPVVDTLIDAGIASAVAELQPLVTVKG